MKFLLLLLLDFPTSGKNLGVNAVEKEKVKEKKWENFL